MSIYTYKTHKALCELFNTEYYEDPSVSDQNIDIIPEDSTGKSFFTYWNSSEEGRRFVSSMVSGDRNPSKRKEVAEKISASLAGKKKTDQHKANMRGPRLSISGKNHPMYGRDRSAEKNPMYGKIWINNGIVNKVIPKETQIPDGFILGVKRKDKNYAC